MGFTVDFSKHDWILPSCTGFSMLLLNLDLKKVNKVQHKEAQPIDRLSLMIDF